MTCMRGGKHGVEAKKEIDTYFDRPVGSLTAGDSISVFDFSKGFHATLAFIWTCYCVDPDKHDSSTRGQNLWAVVTSVASGLVLYLAHLLFLAMFSTRGLLDNHPHVDMLSGLLGIVAQALAFWLGKSMAWSACLYIAQTIALSVHLALLPRVFPAFHFEDMQHFTKRRLCLWFAHALSVWMYATGWSSEQTPLRAVALLVGSVVGTLVIGMFCYWWETKTGMFSAVGKTVCVVAVPVSSAVDACYRISSLSLSASLVILRQLALTTLVAAAPKAHLSRRFVFVGWVGRAVGIRGVLCDMCV